jgi:hypothetical protein
LRRVGNRRLISEDPKGLGAEEAYTNRQLCGAKQSFACVMAKY